MRNILDKDIRITGHLNLIARRDLREEIKRTVDELYARQCGDLESQRELLWDTEKAFVASVWKDIQQAYTNGTLVRIWTQTGPENTLIREYVGKIQSLGTPCNIFNFLRNEPGAKEFSVGMSCMMGIESV